MRSTRTRDGRELRRRKRQAMEAADEGYAAFRRWLAPIEAASAKANEVLNRIEREVAPLQGQGAAKADTTEQKVKE